MDFSIFQIITWIIQRKNERERKRKIAKNLEFAHNNNSTHKKRDGVHCVILVRYKWILNTPKYLCIQQRFEQLGYERMEMYLPTHILNAIALNKTTTKVTKKEKIELNVECERKSARERWQPAKKKSNFAYYSLDIISYFTISGMPNKFKTWKHLYTNTRNTWITKHDASFGRMADVGLVATDGAQCRKRRPKKKELIIPNECWAVHSKDWLFFVFDGSWLVWVISNEHTRLNMLLLKNAKNEPFRLQ